MGSLGEASEGFLGVSGFALGPRPPDGVSGFALGSRNREPHCASLHKRPDPFIPLRWGRGGTVLDFRQGAKAPPNYFARREQKRLLLLIMMLGLLLLLIGKAADPGTWEQLGFGGGGEASVSPGDAPPPQPREYDTRVRPKSPARLPLDTFIARSEQPAEVAIGEEYFPGVVPRHLREVRDHTHLRPQEHEAWFNLLGVLRDAPQEELEAASLGGIGFVQLYEQPNVYRAKLVDAKGTLKRAFDITPPRNEAGIERYYQLWVFPEGGPMNPIIVYSLELPEGMSTSRTEDGGIRNLREPVELTGFYFKNKAYQAGEQILSSPLILAKTITWNREKQSAAAPPEPPSWTMITLVVLGTMLLAGLIAAWVYRSSGQASPAVGELAARYQSQSLRGLEDEQLEPSVAESLQRLEQEED